jgi:hypothetical protein
MFQTVVSLLGLLYEVPMRLHKVDNIDSEVSVVVIIIGGGGGGSVVEK